MISSLCGVSTDSNSFVSYNVVFTSLFSMFEISIFSSVFINGKSLSSTAPKPFVKYCNPVMKFPPSSKLLSYPYLFICPFKNADLAVA